MIALVSDTHGLLRPEAVSALRGAERILHMGDVGSEAVLAGLRALAPTLAIRGNVDAGAWADALRATERTVAFGTETYLIHDLDALDFDPAAAGFGLVLCGHSHRPHVYRKDGVLYVNPGSIGPRRFDLPVSMAYLEPGLEVRVVTLG